MVFHSLRRLNAKMRCTYSNKNIMKKQLSNKLNELLSDENLTDDKLREASEGFLTNIADMLNVDIRKDDLSEKRKKVYSRAVKTWGAQAQMEMALEESIELALAIRKQIRKNNDQTFSNLVEEFADMEIMLEQIEMLHHHLDFRLMVDQQKEFKVKRLKSRLDAKSFESIESEVQGA